LRRTAALTLATPAKHAGGHVVCTDTATEPARVQGHRPARNGSFCRGFPSQCRRDGAARSLPDIARYAPTRATQTGHFQGKQRDGSDGTRTRDLRRDRPLQRSRRARRCTRERTVHAVIRRPPGRLRMATRSGSRRLLPICCPLSSSRTATAPRGSDVLHRSRPRFVAPWVERSRGDATRCGGFRR
jgi:hypothetical protein